MRPTLTSAHVPEYLLARDLISPRTIVDSDLVVGDFSGRNRVFSAECTGGTSYVLKQNSDPDVTTVAREGEVYRELSTKPALRAYMPQFHGYDADGQVLIVEFVRDAEDLASYHRDRRRPSVRISSAIGTVLAALHGLPLEQARLTAAQRGRPSALSVHRPDLRLVREASRASLELIRIIQSTDGFGARLDALNQAWSATTLIHQDVRWKNFMLTTPVRTVRQPPLKLIDWELACLGDPRWDIGSALGNYLSLWLASIPIAGMAPPAQSTELARCPLRRIQPAIRSCWDTYVKRRGLDADTADRLLHSTVGFAAARLVQTAFEAAQGSARLTTNTVLHLQVALNMLQRPQEAAAHLLGLPPWRITDTTGVPGDAHRGSRGARP
jgi:aminoglycoside phosphotransferase (APT) family kinase protein